VAAGMMVWGVGTVADPVGAATSPPPPTSPAAALIPAGAGLIVRDPLTTAGRWEVTTHAPGTTCDFADALVVTSEEASFRCKGPADIMSNMAVWVDLTPLAPGSCPTVWFRFTLADGGYALRTCEEAFYLVTHGAPEPNSVSTLREFWFDTPVTGTTRVGIVADGTELRFYRDGELVGSWSDSTFASGRIGLGLLQMRPEVRPPYQVSFSNIEVYGTAS
jgi:hypothetical protein